MELYDLTDKQQQEVEDFIYTFNKGLVTPARRLFGKKNVIENIDEDFILNMSNNWRDVKSAMKWLSGMRRADLKISGDSEVAKEQYAQAMNKLNIKHKKILDKYADLGINHDYFEKSSNITEMERRFRERDLDLSTEKPGNQKAIYKYAMQRANDKLAQQQDKRYLDNWMQSFKDFVPTLYEQYKDVLNSMSNEEIIMMSYADPYMTIEYFYENMYMPTIDPDSSYTTQELNMIKSIEFWGSVFKQ